MIGSFSAAETSTAATTQGEPGVSEVLAPGSILTPQGPV
jgi:hypothetical protein